MKAWRCPYCGTRKARPRWVDFTKVLGLAEGFARDLKALAKAQGDSMLSFIIGAVWDEFQRNQSYELQGVAPGRKNHSPLDSPRVLK